LATLPTLDRGTTAFTGSLHSLVETTHWILPKAAAFNILFAKRVACRRPLRQRASFCLLQKTVRLSRAVCAQVARLCYRHARHGHAISLPRPTIDMIR